jgi:hypothetical protein
MMSSRPRFLSSLSSLALVLTASLVAIAAMGCSSKGGATPDDNETANDPDAGGNEGTTPTGSIEAGTATKFQLLPATLYSGYDGVHDFRVPVAVYGAKAPKLTASDPSVVTIEPAKYEKPAEDDGIYFLVTTKKAGSVTLTATDGANTATGSLTVATYTPASWVTGNQRYTTSGGPGAPPCTDCHVNGSAIDHSPATMASATDQQIETVIRTGVLVAGNPVRGVDHRWKVTDEQAAGLVTYLRALPPRGITTPAK